MLNFLGKFHAEKVQMIRLCEPIFFFIISSQLGNSSSSDLIDIFRWTEQFGFLNIAYILLIMTSPFGNCALIHIIRTRPLMKTATNRLILNQACADLFVIYDAVCHDRHGQRYPVPETVVWWYRKSDSMQVHSVGYLYSTILLRVDLNRYRR